MRIAIVALAAGLGIMLWILFGELKEARINKAYDAAEMSLTAKATALSSVINRKVAMLRGIAAYVDNTNSLGEELDRFLATLFEDSTGILNTSVYPGGVVAYIYPKSGNEQVMGYNLLSDPRPEVSEAVNRALSTRQVTISGPHELIQGGTGLVARMALFREGTMYSMVGIAMDLPTLLSEAAFDSGPTEGLALRKPGERAFFGEDAVFQERHARTIVQLPDGTWEAASRLAPETVRSILQNIRVTEMLSYILLLLATVFIYYLNGSKNRLQQMVDHRTNELVQSNLLLSEANDHLSAAEEELRLQLELLEERTTALQQSEEQLTIIAYTDTLTGISNRYHVQLELARLLEHARSQHKKLAVILFDLDNFKEINDTFGHIAGDDLLQQWVERLTAFFPAHNTRFARMSGDEFVLVLSDVEYASEVAAAVQQITRLLREPFVLEGYEVIVTASFGSAIFPDHGSDAEQLFKNADTALNRVKEDGGNGARMFEATIGSNGLHKIRLTRDLRRALEERHFRLHYQPQVDSSTGEIVGLEALIRWIHPEKGFISPGEFIPVAEESGLILPISEWVMEEIFRQIRAWREAGLPRLQIAVNLSASSFVRRPVLQWIEQLAALHGGDPRNVEVEITENIAIRQDHAQTLQQLKDRGIRIAIDDFGTKYSALSYLKHFPVHKIKIDKMFIDGIGTEPKDEAIIAAMILVAEGLGLEVIAEGVEHGHQVEFLAALGCRLIQGYYYYRPLDAAATTELLRQSGPAAPQELA